MALIDAAAWRITYKLTVTSAGSALTSPSRLPYFRNLCSRRDLRSTKTARIEDLLSLETIPLKEDVDADVARVIRFCAEDGLFDLVDGEWATDIVADKFGSNCKWHNDNRNRLKFLLQI